LDKGLTKVTVNKYIGLVSKMFNLGIDNDLVIKNPCKGMKFKTKHYHLNILHDGNEQDRLYAALPDYFYGIVLIALNSGLRKSNIQFLQGKNIQLNNRLFEFTENKGNKHIKLPMSEKVYEYLSTLKFKDDDYIFKRPNGKLWTNTAFHNEWHNILKKAGIEKLRFHDLRHTVGTRLAKNNVPVPVIQKIFAHSNIQTTMQYIQTAEEDMKRAIEVLNSYN
jgi:integrase